MEKPLAVSSKGLIKHCFMLEGNVYWSETVKVRVEMNLQTASSYTSQWFFYVINRKLNIFSAKLFSGVLVISLLLFFIHGDIQYAEGRGWYFIDFQKCSTWHLYRLEINLASLFLLFGERAEKWECTQRWMGKLYKLHKIIPFSTALTATGKQPPHVPNCQQLLQNYFTPLR